MQPDSQTRVLIIAGAVGGVLRIAAAFIPYTPESAGLEALYAAVDIGLLLGLVGLHMQTAARTGAAGFLFFVIALAALASIVGPDATAFGIDFYRVGASVFALALAGWAACLLRARAFVATGWLWITCAASGVVASATGSAPAFMAAGVALGLGFVATALADQRRSYSSP